MGRIYRPRGCILSSKRLAVPTTAHFDQNSTRFIFIKPSTLLDNANLKPGDVDDTKEGLLIGVDATDTTTSTSISSSTSATVIGSDPYHGPPAAKQLNPRRVQPGCSGGERNTYSNQESAKKLASVSGYVVRAGNAAPASRRIDDSRACAGVQPCQRMEATKATAGKYRHSEDDVTWNPVGLPCKHGRQHIRPPGENDTASRVGPLKAKRLAAETTGPARKRQRVALFPEPDLEKVRRLVKFFEEHCTQVTTATSDASGNTRPQVLTVHALFWNDLWAKGLIDVTDLPTTISRRVDSSDLPTNTAEMDTPMAQQQSVADNVERVDSTRRSGSSAICTRDTRGSSALGSTSSWKIQLKDLIHAPKTRAGLFRLGERYGGLEFGRIKPEPAE